MSGTLQRAEARRASRALYAEGRIDDAIERIQGVLASHPDSPNLDEHLLLSLFTSAKGDFQAALKVTQRTQALFPESPDCCKNIAAVLIHLNRPKEALSWIEKALALNPEDASVHDYLAGIHGPLRNRPLAQKHGELALELKNAEAAGRKQICDAPVEAPSPFDPAARDRNVIAFSLWGDNPRYTEGAIRNTDLAAAIYPEWRCRFYCGSDVAEDVIAELIALGADVVRMPDSGLLYEGLFWRFLVASEPGVSRFLVRDADSVFSLRERVAVEEWLDSDKHFHVIRDSYSHTDLMLAGLWGGVGGILPPLKQHIDPYLRDGIKTGNCDQRFLCDQVWPVVRHSVMTHDSWFDCLGSRPFPARAFKRPGFHVGQNASLEPLPAAGRFSVHEPGADSPAAVRRKRYIFTITTGRSGTTYLAKLLDARLDGAEVHHERSGFRSFGRTTPDASHFMQFNAVGNVPAVREFWRRKLTGMSVGETEIYVETSHYLAKAGLLENLAFLGSEAEIHIVVLDRELESLVWSFANRMDFANVGFTWLFALDPRYPRNIVSYEPLSKYGMFGSCFWYVIEMRARAAYYRRLLRNWPNLQFHQVDLESISTRDGAERLLKDLGRDDWHPEVALPGRENANQNELFNDSHRREIRDMIAAHPFDPEALAEAYLATGRRIGKIG